MTLQNRVTPWGEIVATPERGAWMGNRGGCFHDERQQLTSKRWVTKQWITCRLEFKGWHREVMTPRRYTELFFLDEATALAAGHRPCFECRREDALRFREAWATGTGMAGPAPRVAEMDAVLHGERVSGKEKRTFAAELGALPVGVMIRGRTGEGALLVAEGKVLPWSFAGYGQAQALEPRLRVEVLTPASIVAAIGAGYEPQVHESAGDWLRRRP